MIKLRVLEILNNMVKGETKSIKYANLDVLCQILNCNSGDFYDCNPNKSVL